VDAVAVGCEAGVLRQRHLAVGAAQDQCEDPGPGDTTDENGVPKGFGPIAAGFGLTLVHLISIPVSNTSVNPARSLATAVFQGDWALGQVWAFIVFPAIGALLAGALWYVVGPTPARTTSSTA